VLGFGLDGAWVSFVAAAGAAALVAASRRTFARVPVGPARFAAAAGVGAVVLFGVAAHGRSGTRAGLDDAAATPRAVARPDGERPNVVLISIDSLRADHLGCYGYPRATSPHIDALAATGMRFTTTWSSTSWTLPAHVSLLTGRTLLGHGVREYRDTIPPSVPLLAEQLQKAGYATAGVVAAPFLSARYGFARGFDHYDESAVSSSHADSWRGETSPKSYAGASSWLREHRREPFFLFVHFWDVHYDYDPPPPYDTMFDPDYTGSIGRADFISNPKIRPGMAERDLDHVRALYDGEIRYTDEHVGKLLDLVGELGLRERTIVILTADHGEEFFEHGRKGHERTLYEEVLHVPLVITWPGRIAPGQVATEPVSLVDVTPTILDLLRAPAPAGIEGRPLVSDEGQPVPARRLLVAELYRQSMLNFQIAVREGSQKFMQSLKSPRVEFYDLERDPGETKRAGLDPARRDRLRAETAGWVAANWPRAAGLRDGAPVVLDAEKLKALRALGYVE
jgi:arylsulfatase A-like enzyme